LFSGRYNCKIDGKNRFIFPVKLRNQIFTTYKQDRPRLVLTLSFGNPSLVLMSEEQWEGIGQVESIDMLNPIITDSFRLMSMVAYLEMDEVGRITLPDYLTEMVGISDHVTLLGCRSYIELWETESASAHLKDLHSRAAEIMQKLRAELNSKKDVNRSGEVKGREQ
jgi:division/cell wall cluster transcriptional repressor MraZ